VLSGQSLKSPARTFSSSFVTLLGVVGMSLSIVEYVLRGWLWVVPIKQTIAYISPGELECLIILLT